MCNEKITITDADRAAAEEIVPGIYGRPPAHPDHYRRAVRVKNIATIIARHRSEREKVLVEALRRLIADFELEIHNEYDGTQMLKDRLAEVDYARHALKEAGCEQ